MKETEEDLNFYNLFTPLTTKKAIIWSIIIGFIVHFNMLFNNFVEDDLSYIIENPLTHTINIPYAFGQNLFNTAGQYRPIPALYFSILYTLFSTSAFYYHVVQLALHIAVNVFIFIFISKIFSKNTAFLLSLIFLVHPINVESVAYIAQSISPLFVLPGIVALLISTKKKLTNKDCIGIFSLLLLSALVKEAGILFFFLIFVYRFLFVRSNLIKFSIGGVITLLIYFSIRFFIGNVHLTTRPLIPIADTTLSERLINMPQIFFYYLKTFFLPYKLAVDQQWVITNVDFNNFYFPLIFDLIFFTLCFLTGVYLFRKNKAFKRFLFFFCWFSLGLSLHLQVFPLDKTVADRWFYFPIIGILGMIGLIVNQVLLQNPGLRRYVYAGILLLIIVLSVRTIARNSNWRDMINLYSHDIKYNDNFDISNGLGVAYGKEREYSKAIYYLEKSVRMRPYEINHLNLAIIYARIGKMAQAKLFFEKAFNSKNYKLYPSNNRSLNLYKNYAQLLLFYEKNPLSTGLLEESVRDYPDSSALWSYLAIAYYMQHDNKSALKAAARAYELNPSTENRYAHTQIKNNDFFEVTFVGFKGEKVEIKIE